MLCTIGGKRSPKNERVIFKAAAKPDFAAAQPEKCLHRFAVERATRAATANCYLFGLSDSGAALALMLDGILLCYPLADALAILTGDFGLFSPHLVADGFGALVGFLMDHQFFPDLCSLGDHRFFVAL